MAELDQFSTEMMAALMEGDARTSSGGEGTGGLILEENAQRI